MNDLHDRLSSALSERYELDREIGRGGMAVVYLATDLKQGRQVALKVFQPDIAAAMGPARFQREIEIATRLEHPHILSLYDSGEAEGLLYYVMPFVAEESLRQRLDREGQLPIEDALRIAREMAEALDYAHDQGVVHRDVKPGNVLLQRGHALLADFGVARALEASGGEKLTGTGVSVGTPHYMAPEQATGAESADARSDVYAVGAVLYEMLTGEPPYTGSTPQAVLARRLAGPPTPIPVLRDTVPPELDALVQKAMARSAADRWQSAGDLVRALSAAERGGTPIPGLSTWPGMTGEITGAGEGPKRGRRWAVPAVAAVAATGLVLAGIWYSGERAVEDKAAADLPELDPMLVLVVPERPADRDEWKWTGILADRVKRLGDLRIVDRSEAEARLASTALLPTSAADSVAAGWAAGRFVLVGASQIGEGIRLNMRLYATGDPTRLLAGVDTTVSELDHDVWAPAVVVRLFENQQKGLTSEADEAALNTGSVDPDAEIWASRGLGYFARGQYDSATIAFQNAVRIDSLYVEAWGMLSRAAGFWQPFNLPPDHDSVVAFKELSEQALGRFRQLGGAEEVTPSLSEARRLAAANPRSARAQYELYQAIRSDYWKRGWPPDSALPPLLASIELDPYASYNRFALIVHYLCVGKAEELRRTDRELANQGLVIPARELWPALAGMTLGSEVQRDSIIANTVPLSGNANRLADRLLLLQDDMRLVARTAEINGYPEAYNGQIYAALAGGRWNAALELIQVQERGPYLSHRSALAGAGVLDVPDEQIRALRDSTLADVQELALRRALRLQYIGLMSAQLGEFAMARAFADSLEHFLPADSTEGDHRPEEVAAAAADAAIEVYALAARLEGRTEDALALLERQAFESVDDWGDYRWIISRTHGRFLRAEILYGMGRYEEAAGWYATIPRVKMWNHRNLLLLAPVFRGRAKALDALGRYEEALHYYRRFATRWQNADPHLQPQVEEARQRIRELEAELN